MASEEGRERSAIKSKIVDRITQEVELAKAGKVDAGFVTGTGPDEQHPGETLETYYKTYYKGGSYVKG